MSLNLLTGQQIEGHATPISVILNAPIKPTASKCINFIHARHSVPYSTGSQNNSTANSLPLETWNGKPTTSRYVGIHSSNVHSLSPAGTVPTQAVLQN